MSITPRARRVIVLLAFACLASLSSSSPAEASHFRFGHVSWDKTGTSSAQFSVTQAWRRDSLSCETDCSDPDFSPAVGDVVDSDGAMDFGDGSFVTRYKVVAINKTDNWAIIQGLDPGDPTGTSDTLVDHTYATADNAGSPWVPFWASCCNISESRNAADAAFRVDAWADLDADTESPHTNLPPIVPTGTTGVVTFTIPVVYSGAGTVRFRLATPEEACSDGFDVCTDPQPDGLQVNQTTGQVTWDLDAWRTAHPSDGEPNGLWFSSVIMEAFNGPTILSRSQVTYLINVGGTGGSETNNAPTWTPQTPPGGVIEAPVGQMLNLNLGATDQDAGDTITINHVGLPEQDAPVASRPTFSATNGNPASGTFTWTPAADQLGDHLVSFTAQDDGVPPQQAPLRQFTIRVVDQPNVTIGDATAVTEGNAGTTSMTFPVTLSVAPDTGETVTVGYDTANGTATAGADYVGVTNGTVTFNAGETTKDITVTVNGDTMDEDNETLSVTLDSFTGAIAGNDVTGAGTINDDDDPPTVSIADLSQAEGSSGAGSNANLAVTLSAPSGKTVTVPFTTAVGTATAGSDYTAVGNPGLLLTFAPGDTSESAAVSVIGDTIDEVDETVLVNLGVPTNATTNDGAAVLTITDDDNPPTIQVEPASVVEGNSGTKTLTLTVGLSSASGKPVSVDWATGGGTASVGDDYVAGSGTLEYPAGTTSQPINITVNGDTIDEVLETITVTLSNATNANLPATPTVNGRITDDDGPGITVGGATVTEGGTLEFTVTLSGTSVQPVKVDYATTNGTAAAPGDYTAATGTLEIPAGSTTGKVSVPTVQDTADEPNETLTLTISNAQDGTIAGGSASATGTINDDDPTPPTGEGPVGTDGSGMVLVKRPGERAFTPLTFGSKVELGTIIDATNGVVKLIVPCPDCPGGVQAGEFYGGRFVVLKTRGAKPTWEIMLEDAYNVNKPKKNGIPKAFDSSYNPIASMAAAKRTMVWGKAKGRWRTTGRYGAATIRGTEWLVDDRQAGKTKVRVKEGSVKVRDFVKKKTVTVKAGKSYVARAKKKKKRR